MKYKNYGSKLQNMSEKNKGWMPIKYQGETISVPFLFIMAMIHSTHQSQHNDRLTSLGNKVKQG